MVIDPVSVQSQFIDQNENIYVLHRGKTYIEVFDKNGNRNRRINVTLPSSIRGYRMRVDEEGRIFMVATFGVNDPGVICDPNGKELAHINSMQDYYNFGFSNGVVYSKRDGKVLFQLLPSSKPNQSRFFKDFDETEDDERNRREVDRPVHTNRNLHLPSKVGSYSYRGVMEIAYDGSSYVKYETEPLPNPGDYQNPIIHYSVCVFDPAYHLVGIIPRYLPFVNLQTGKVYETFNNYEDAKHQKEVAPKTISVFRWEKRP